MAGSCPWRFLAVGLIALAALAAPSPAVTAGDAPPTTSGAEVLDPAAFPKGCNPDGEAYDPSPAPLGASRIVADARSEPEVLVRLASGLEPLDPAQLTIDEGTCVVFRNDGPTHTLHVEADSTGNVAVTIEERLQRGDTVRVTFGQAGVYELHCRTHPFLMHGVLDVR